MAMPPSAEAPSPLLDWALLAVGVVVAALCVWFAPVLAGLLAVESVWGATALFNGLIFAPMIVTALGFSLVAGASAFRLGERAVWWTCLGLLTGVGGVVVSAGYAALAGGLSSGTGAQVGAGLVVGLMIIAFLVLGEEIFFRAWMQPLLVRRLGWIAGLGITAALFAGFHLLGGARSPLTMLNLLIGGVWFGLLAWRSAGLVAPVAAHLGWNVSEELLLGLYPNPGVGDFGAICDWNLVGSPFWGGSEEGLNASIAVTFVLVALIIPLIWRESLIATVVPVPHPPGRAVA